MSETQKKLNVLMVISDQHIAACMGCEGHAQAITPNMDRLAAMGMRFSQAYTQNPICTPSRISILSGQYCHNHGYYGLSGPTPLGLPSLFEHYHRGGYCTAGIGKLHLPTNPEYWGEKDMDRFADCYLNELGRPSPYYHYLEDLGLRAIEDSVALPEFPGMQQHEGRPSNLPYEHSVEGWCVQQAVDFIDESGEQPFFIQVALPRPHQCYTPDRRFWEMYPEDLDLPETFYDDPSGRPPHFRRMVAYLREDQEWLIEPKTLEDGSRRVWRAYLACITQVDYSLGLLIDHLERTGKLQDTIIIYGADHGAYSGTFGVPEKAPGICSESVCRVPLIWYVPGLTPPGSVCDRLVENIDLASTLPYLTGTPPMETTDGCNIAGLLGGGSEPVRQVAVTENPWSKALRWGPWRFVHYQPEMFNHDVGELYHLQDDPLERNNLYHNPKYREIVEQSRRLLLQWLIRTTRFASMWPYPGEEPYNFLTQPDGKESNRAGAFRRLENGQLNYL